MTTSKQLAVTLTSPSYAIGHESDRAVYLTAAVPAETLSPAQRSQQANHLIGGVRRFLANRPEFVLKGSDADMVAFAKQVGGLGNIWVGAR